MGGASKHINHVWEITDYTFNDLYNLIHDGLNGNIKNASEKLDGQNMLITFIDGICRMARTTSHFKNPLDYQGIINYFTEKKSNSKIKKQYLESYSMFVDMFNNTDKDKIDSLFQNGKFWANVEILNKDNPNIIYYDKNELRVHNLFEIKDGKIINTKEFPESFNFKNIKKTNKVILKTIPLNFIIEDYLVKLLDEENISDYGYSPEEVTIGDYLENKFDKLIQSNINIHLKDFDTVINHRTHVQLLAKRWGKGDKSTRINIITKNLPKQSISWIKYIEKNHKKYYEEFLYPIKKIISLLGIAVLQNIKNNISISDETVEKEYYEALNYFKENKDIIESSKSEYIQKNIDEFEELGGISSLLPIEGIVFDYKGHIIKLCGSFIPILRIIGFYRFKS